MIQRLSLLLAAVVATCGAADASLVGVELIVNGGAETGNTSGWIADGVEAVPAEGNHAGFGDFAFTGGTGDAGSQTLQQIIDVTPLAAQIDAQAINSSFAVQLQSRGDGMASDSAEATLFFRDVSNAVIASALFSDPDFDAGDWDLYQDARLVPVGTRVIEVLLNTSRTGGVSSDGYFDDVSLQLTAVTEPSSLAMLGLCCAGLWGTRIRRRAWR